MPAWAAARRVTSSRWPTADRIGGRGDGIPSGADQDARAACRVVDRCAGEPDRSPRLAGPGRGQRGLPGQEGRHAAGASAQAGALRPWPLPLLPLERHLPTPWGSRSTPSELPKGRTGIRPVSPGQGRRARGGRQQIEGARRERRRWEAVVMVDGQGVLDRPDRLRRYRRRGPRRRALDRGDPAGGVPGPGAQAPFPQEAPLPGPGELAHSDLIFTCHALQHRPGSDRTGRALPGAADADAVWPVSGDPGGAGYPLDQQD